MTSSLTVYVALGARAGTLSPSFKGGSLVVTVVLDVARRMLVVEGFAVAVPWFQPRFLLPLAPLLLAAAFLHRRLRTAAPGLDIAE